MTRPVLLMVILAIAVGTISGVTGLFFKVGISFTEPHPIKVLSTPLLTPSGSDVRGHVVVRALGREVILERIEVFDKNGDAWGVNMSVSLGSGSKPITFVLKDAVSYFPVGFSYLGILVSDAGTTYTTFTSIIPSTSGKAVEWAQFMYDAQNTGYVGGPLPTQLSTVVWKTKVADDHNNVRGGPIYTSSGLVVLSEAKVGGKSEPRISLIDPKTGELKNDFIIEGAGSPTFAPVAGYGLIYFATEKYVMAVDPQTGEIAWKVSQDDIGDGFELKPADYPYYGYLAMEDSRVVLYTLVVQYINNRYTTKPGLVCFDAKTGNILWKDALGPGSHNWFQITNSPVVVNGTVWIVDPLGEVWGVRIEDGSVIFSMKLGSRYAIREWIGPALYHGYLYYYDVKGRLVCIDTNNAVVKWRKRIGDTLSSPIVVNNIVYAPYTSGIKAFKYDDGTLLWRKGGFELKYPIIVAKKYVYAVDDDSCILYIFNATSGRLVFKYNFGWQGIDFVAWVNTMMLYDGMLYTVNDDGYIFAIGP